MRNYRRAVARLCGLGFVVGALALPTGAAAAPREYSGHIVGDSTATIDFTVRGQGDNRRVRPFELDNLPIHGVTPGACSSGRTGAYTFQGPYAVNRRNRFRVDDTEYLFHGFSLEVLAHGELRHRAGSPTRAIGTIQATVVDDMGNAECATGTLDWAGRRQ